MEVLRGESKKREILRGEGIHWETLKKILACPEKAKGSWNVQDGQVSYHCFQGNTHEVVPADVVSFFDVSDPGTPFRSSLVSL